MELIGHGGGKIMDFTQILFVIISAFVVFSIIKALTVEKVMQSVYWLILMLISVSIFFLLGMSEIIFVFQLSIYSGGISVLLLFAGVLTERDEYPYENFLKATWVQLLIILIMLINILALIYYSVTSGNYTIITQLGDTTRTYSQAFDQLIGFAVYFWNELGEALLLLGFLITTAIVGSVKLAIREEEIEDLSEEVILRLKQEKREAIV